MTMTQNIRTTTGSGITFCKRRGWRGLSARLVIVASGNQNVHEWLYRYLEPYTDRGYAFYLVDSETEFLALVQKKPVMAFIEDCFFGEKIIGRLERVRKQYPKLPLALFSVSAFPAGSAVRYIIWSGGNYVCLRDSELEIREALGDIFKGRQAIPASIRDSVERYDFLPDINPHLTHREIEVVRCIAEEKTLKKTAYCLMVSEKTVSNHLTSVYQKFGIRNKVGVLKLAVSKGILPVDELMTYTVQS